MEDRVPVLHRSPREFVDADGRRIRIERADTVATKPVLDMYLDLDGRCRAMGIPPVTQPDLRDWLESLEDGLNMVARNERDVVGHAVLLPASDSSHELAIFVHQAFQNAGIGTELLRTLLGDARSAGISKIWLSVACGNGPAKRLFRSIGFEVRERSRRQLTMELEL